MYRVNVKILILFSSFRVNINTAMSDVQEKEHRTHNGVQTCMTMSNADPQISFTYRENSKGKKKQGEKREV